MKALVHVRRSLRADGWHTTIRLTDAGRKVANVLDWCFCIVLAAVVFVATLCVQAP
jgi:hypothetical protein